VRTQTQGHDIAVLARALGVEAQLIAGEVGPASQEEAALRPSVPLARYLDAVL
jgi:hypothetical protein